MKIDKPINQKQCKHNWILEDKDIIYFNWIKLPVIGQLYHPYKFYYRYIFVCDKCFLHKMVKRNINITREEWENDLN